MTPHHEAMRTWLLLLVLALAGCGDSPATVDVEPIDAPRRTAAQDRALRRLAIDALRHRACPALRDRFLPLPEDRPAAQRRAIEGRLWVSECRLDREAETLSLRLQGRGWQWVERSAAGPLGSSFTVRGTVRLDATVSMTSELDLRYDEDAHRALVALTPTESPRATVTPIGTIPVAPDGGWSSLIGGLGGLLGASPQAQARPLLEQEAAGIVRRQLAGGATLSVDLCTGQPDLVFGPVGDGEAVEPPPFEGGEGLWLDNARVRLHPEGLEISGPWDTGEGDGAFELEVESGGPVDARVLCRADAAVLASQFLAGGRASLPAGASQQTVRDRATLALRNEDCASPHVVLTASTETTVRYRVTRDDLRPEAYVDCQ